MLRYVTILLASLVIYPHINAQNGFVHYTKTDGLSDNFLSGITQDSTGYIWICGFSGINRYDGTNFLQFHSNDDSSSVPAEMTKGLDWLDDHRIAINTTAGLHIINTRTGTT